MHGDRIQAASDLLEAARSRVGEPQTVAFDAQRTSVPGGALIVELKDFNVSFPGGSQLWQQSVNFSLLGPKRLSVLGGNGRGKTLFLREVARLAQVPVACLDQDLSLLRAFQTAADVMQAFAPRLREDERRTRLARGGFAQDRGAARLAGLSGGERMRLALCAVLSQEPIPKLLILDEPTNDLDVKSLETLARTLRLFRGALLVVSHDETFLQEAGVDESLELPRRATISVPARQRRVRSGG